jgi:hypothetical protein
MFITPAGNIVDIQPGSHMEAAYGLANLTPLDEGDRGLPSNRSNRST